MASFSNTIKTVIDVSTDKATAGVKSFKQSIQDADGASGKLKAGFGQAGDFIKANAAGIAASAGTALIGFAVKSVAAFNDVALESGRMADALGISAESASRWVEVAGDIGASTEDVTKAMTRMEREVAKNPKQFDELGVSIARTETGAVDANETFLRTVEALKRIKDPTERQEAANKLLGRSWGNIAELVNGDVREAFNSVADAKVIDADQVEKARAMRDALDELKGAAENAAMEVGSALTPAITQAAQTASDSAPMLAKVVGWFAETADATFKTMQGTTGVAQNAKRAMDSLPEPIDAVSARMTEMARSFQASEADAADLTDEIAELEEETLKLIQTVNAAIDSDLGYQRALNGTEDAAKDLYEKVVKLNEAQGDDRAAALEEVQRSELDLLGAYVAQSEAAVKLYADNIALAGGTLGAADAARIQRDELLKVKATLDPGSPLAVALQGYIDKLGGIPGVVYTQAEIDTRAAEGKIAELRRQMGALGAFTGTPRSGYTDPAAVLKALQGVDLSGLANLPQGATGGIVTRPTMALIGEAGPEAVVPLNRTPGSSPLPGMGGVNISVTVNAGMGTDGNLVGRQILDVVNRTLKQQGRPTL